MENTDDVALLLADVAALVDAIDADADTSPQDVLPAPSDAEAALCCPLGVTGDEWWLADDLFDSIPPDASPAKTRSPGSTSDDVEPKSTSTTRVKSCRERQKAEIVYLKQRVEELHRQLQQLRQTPQDDPQNESSGQLAVSDAVRMFWRQRAESERRARERAVMENARLRQSLEAQLRVAKSLARVLQKRPNDTDLFPDGERIPKRHRLHDAGEGEIYAFLMHDMDARYTQVDAVWRACGLSSCRSVLQDARYVEAKHCDDRAPWYLEFVDSKVAGAVRLRARA